MMVASILKEDTTMQGPKTMTSVGPRLDAVIAGYPYATKYASSAVPVLLLT